MGAGSAALLWYACCCSFVAFTGIVAAGLTVYGRKREERVRSLRPVSEDQQETPPEPSTTEPTEPTDPDAST